MDKVITIEGISGDAYFINMNMHLHTLSQDVIILLRWMICFPAVFFWQILSNTSSLELSILITVPNFSLHLGCAFLFPGRRRRRRKEIMRLVVEAKAAYLGWREARQKIRIRGTA